MIPKNIEFRPPWNDAYVVQLELLLSSMASNSLQAKSGTYTGDLRDSRELTLNIHPLFVYIQKKTAGSGSAVFALRDAVGVSFIPGGGFVSDAVKSFTPNGITIGTNADINAIGTEYAYLAIG